MAEGFSSWLSLAKVLHSVGSESSHNVGSVFGRGSAFSFSFSAAGESGLSM